MIRFSHFCLTISKNSVFTWFLVKTSFITFDKISESITRLQVQDNLTQSAFNLSHYADQCVDLPLINSIKQRKIMAIMQD